MRLNVHPIYGWGWFREGTGRAMDVPADFNLDVEAVSTIGQSEAFLGQLPSSTHPLGGLWVLLTQRHVEKDGFYNLLAYQERALLPDNLAQKIEAPALISGFAQAWST